jgi:hypothetical protein
MAENTKAEKLLEEWVKFCAVAEEPIDSCITISALHGVSYEGPSWSDLLQRTQYYLDGGEGEKETANG